jgi:multisubunit Na+/H+ antiporter MnhB subunit
MDDEAWLMGDGKRGPARPAPHRTRRPLEPHRGSTILVLGILGLVVCFICGIFAWTMGNEDLAKMRAGRMDEAGRSATEAGRVLGIISVVLSLAGLAFLGLAMCAGAFGAAHGSSF